MGAADEILDVVDEHDQIVGRAPRGQVYAEGLRHRAVFVQARDPDGRIFVHRRTQDKLVCPSLHDMFVGGVVGAGESYDDAALREAEEELGVTGLPHPRFLFRFLYADGGSRRWWSSVYDVECPVDRPSTGRGGGLARLPHRVRARAMPGRVGVGAGWPGGVPAAHGHRLSTTSHHLEHSFGY